MGSIPLGLAGDGLVALPIAEAELAFLLLDEPDGVLLPRMRVKPPTVVGSVGLLFSLLARQRRFRGRCRPVGGKLSPSRGTLGRPRSGGRNLPTARRSPLLAAVGLDGSVRTACSSSAEALPGDHDDHEDDGDLQGVA